MNSDDVEKDAVNSILGQIVTGHLEVENHLELSIVTDAIIEYAKKHNLM